MLLGVAVGLGVEVGAAAQLTRLLIGLWIFGTGDALLVIAKLGNSPWTVFAAGVGEQTPAFRI